MKRLLLLNLIVLSLLYSCGKKTSDGAQPPSGFILNAWSLNGVSSQPVYYASLHPVIRFNFSSSINKSTVNNSISFLQSTTPVAYGTGYSNGESTILISPSSPLAPLTKYRVTLSNNLQSTSGGKLVAGIDV